MVEILFSRIKFEINGKKCDVWFASVRLKNEQLNLIFDTKADALDWCSARDLTCGFME